MGVCVPVHKHCGRQATATSNLDLRFSGIDPRRPRQAATAPHEVHPERRANAAWRIHDHEGGPATTATVCVAVPSLVRDGVVDDGGRGAHRRPSHVVRWTPRPRRIEDG